MRIPASRFVVAAIAIVTLTSFPSAVATPEIDSNFRRHADPENGHCDKSSPLAPHQVHDDNHNSRHLKVATPNDPTRRSYAPLCPDGLHIDMRHLAQCDPGMCFVAAYQLCFHSTSFECNADILLPNPSPTARPTFPVIESVHPVKLVLKNVPGGYSLSEELKSLILRYVSEILEGSLEEVGLQFVKVDYAGRLKMKATNNNNNNDNSNGSRSNQGNGIKGPRPDSGKDLRKVRHLRRARHIMQQRQRRLDSLAVPLAVTVKGPEDISDFALSYIMETLRENFGDLIAYLKENGGAFDGNMDVNGDGLGSNGGDDGNAFANVQLSAEEFDFADIATGISDPPTEEPTRRPTTSPTKQEEEEESEVEEENNEDQLDVLVNVVDRTSNNGVVVMDETTKAVIPWWVWLIIMPVIVLLCMCCVCGFLRRRRDNPKTQQKKQDQQIDIWMQGGSVVLADSKKMHRTSRRVPQQRRQPRSIGNETQRASNRHSMNNETRRNSKNRPARVRPGIARHVSQTELDEEARAREYEGDDVITEMARPQGPIVPIDPSNADIVSAISVNSSMDPPEENALVLYTPRVQLDDSNRSGKTEPDGSKIPKQTSMYASEVYSNKHKRRNSRNRGGVDRSDRSGIDGSDRSGIDRSERSEDPDGAKIPKKGSMYASEAIVLHKSSCPDPVVSDYEQQREEPRGRRAVHDYEQQRKEPRGRRVPKKDSMFTCPVDDLPEDVRSKARSRATGRELRGEIVVKRKKRKSRKKGNRGATEKLKASLTRRPRGDDTPRDIFIDHDSMSQDSASFTTKPPALRKDDNRASAATTEHRDIDRSERSGDERVSGNRTSESKKRNSRTSEQFYDSASRRPGKDVKGSVFSTFTKRLSWHDDADISDDGSAGYGKSIQIEDFQATL